MKTFQQLYEIVSRKQALAREYARIAHDNEGQVRKGSGDRYWVHPQGIADTLEGYGIKDENILCAAELHDTLEDCKVSFANLEDMFDEEVAILVDELTNLPNIKKEDKENYMSRKMVRLSDDALTVKLGDCLYNLLDKPKVDQVSRMYNNIKYVKKNRKLRRIHKELIDAFITGYESKFSQLI